MNVTLKQLRAFIAAVQTGSFTAAAQRMFITQSALSSLIKEFEGALGVRLMDRGTRQIELTDVGQGFFPLVVKIVEDLDRVVADLSEFNMLKRGQVRVAAPQLMSCTLLPEFIAAYNQKHPDIRIRLVDTPVEDIMAMVLAGDVDLAIGPERGICPSVESRHLFELPFVAVFPSGHALEAQVEVRWAELATYPFISLRGQFAERLAIDLHASISNSTAASSQEVAFMSTALSMASNGLGVTACIPYADSLVRLFKLEMRPLCDPVVKRRFFVFTRRGRTLSPAAESVMEFLSEFCSSRWPAK